jgi:hypothetical protein
MYRYMEKDKEFGSTKVYSQKKSQKGKLNKTLAAPRAVMIGTLQASAAGHNAVQVHHREDGTRSTG